MDILFQSIDIYIEADVVYGMRYMLKKVEMVFSVPFFDVNRFHSFPFAEINVFYLSFYPVKATFGRHVLYRLSVD